MEKFTTWLSDVFAPKMQNIFAIPWIAALSGAMQKVIPFILAGSVISFYNVIAYFVPGLPDLSPLFNFTFGCISILVAFMMAQLCMEQLNHPFYTTNAGLTAICALLLAVTPTDTAAEGGLATLINAIGASGLAVGIIIGLFTAIVFHLWSKLHVLEESSLPDFVTGWINTICPILIVLGVLMVLVYPLGIDISSAVLAVFTPITAIAQTLPGMILCCCIPAFFYTMGISSWAFGAITTPIMLAGINENIAAVAAGLPATNIVTSEATFTLAFVTMGGMCCTLGLNVLMCFSKSRKTKLLGRAFIVPSIFNINEPVMYGCVVFNPLLMMPAWICSLVGAVYTYLLMSTGLLNIPSKLMQVGQIPAPFCSVMITEDMRAILWWVVLFVIYLVIWYPFFKAWERKQLEEEAAAAAPEA